ncbi:MAG: VIT family protein [Hyphomicrobium sp.]|nr:VIT family protein [Hyphomicrobium sp.]
MAENESSILDPLERASEIIFGLIMALTFTSTISLLATKADVHTMLAGAIGCNLAWGIVDAAMYLLAQIVTRERWRTLALTVASASTVEARRLIAEHIPLGAGKIFTESELDRLAGAVRASAIPERRVMPTGDEWRGAAGIFMLVFLSTFPVALPFVFLEDVGIALRTSNAIAVALLFAIGAALGKHMGWSPSWAPGAIVGVFGAVLVGITIALGG